MPAGRDPVAAVQPDRPGGAGDISRQFHHGAWPGVEPRKVLVPAVPGRCPHPPPDAARPDQRLPPCPAARPPSLSDPHCNGDDVMTTVVENPITTSGSDP